MTEMTNTLDKRNFCLMLSAITGQSVANQLGFAPVSQDVEEMEHELIEHQWETLHDFGIFDEVVESVEWFAQVLATTSPELQTSPATVENTKGVILSYSMALVQNCCLITRLLCWEQLCMIIVKTITLRMKTTNTN